MGARVPRATAKGRRVGGLLVAAALLAALPAHAASVPVRASAHANYGRMVFDWPQKVDFTAAVEGERLVIRFDQPVEAALDRVVKALPSYLAAGRVAADGRSVEFDLKRPVALKSFRNGNAVAIDLTPAAAPPAQPTPAQPAQPPAAKAGAPATPPAASVAPAAKGGTVKLRAGDHATHSRLAFDWSAPTAYTLQRDGASVTLLFDRAASIDLSPATKAPLRNVRNVEQFKAPNGGLAVTFAAAPDSDVREFRNGASVVVDVLNPGTRKAPEPVPVAEAKPAEAKPAEAKPATPPPAVPAPAPVKDLPVPPGATTTSVKPPPAAPAPPPPPAAPPTQPAAPQATVKPAEKGPMLVFDAGGPAAAAVYPRAGYLYIVFDKALPIGAGAVVGPGAEQVGAIEPVPATAGSVFRTRIGPFIWPTVERQGTVWRVVPSTRLTAAPPQELRVDAEPDFLLGARLVVRASDAAAVVQVADPEVGDRLQVVPLPVAGQTVSEGRRYADLEMLPAFQGVVVRPVSDSVTVRPVKEGVELTSAGGLHLSTMADSGVRPGQAPTPPAAPAPTNPAVAQTPSPGGASPAPQAPLAPATPGAIAAGKRLFEPEVWQRGGLDRYTENRQALQHAVADAPDGERPKAQLDLARFYFANGFGPETLGMLDVLQQAQPDLDGWPEFRALRGAARVLAGDLDGGREDLTHPGLANNAEAALWRGVIAVQQNDWPKAARDFKTGGAVLAKYPDPLLSRLALPAAEAALQIGDVNEAKRWLDRVEQKIGTDANERPDMQYLRGEQYRLQGDVGHAREELTAAFNSLDRYYRAKAGLALTNLEVAEGRMSPAAAAEQLAGLTFTWRGDDLEVAIRQRLGEMQIAGGKYADGFNTMKETAALVGEGPKAEQITKEMARTFADLYKDGAAKLPTLEALQLYDQFRELTPVGTAGDDIIRQLAERLIQIDLLGKAADLLQHQVEYRLSGQEKANVGTRLASVRLLDNKPQEALKALELSNVPGIPADLQGERMVMQAKALAELGRGNEALLLLAQDDSKEANLLRVDIAWRAQNWGQAAVALGKVIGPPPASGQPLDPNASQLVLNRAVALALAGDGTGLSQLRKEFGTGMEKGPDADAFRVLTRPDQATGLIDVNTIRSRVAEVDVFQKFLKGYKGRTSAPAAPAAGKKS